jgi:hypothetical protein
MANYFSDGISESPFLADEDLTAWQYKLVKITASDPDRVERFTHITLGSGSPLPIGVLQNDPSSGQSAAVKVLGFAKVYGRVSVCDLAAGAWLMSASDGMVEAASAVDSTAEVVGRWIGPNNTTDKASIAGNMLVYITGTCAAVDNQ